MIYEENGTTRDSLADMDQQNCVEILFRAVFVLYTCNLEEKVLHQTGSECDKPAVHKNNTNHVRFGQAMEQTDYKQYITTSGKFRVILEYPREAKEEEAILKEVKEVLNHLLREQIAK